MRASVAESISAFLSSHDKKISTKDNRLHLKLETKVKPVPLKKKELAAKMLAAHSTETKIDSTILIMEFTTISVLSQR
jgi:hypothetical protein